MTIQDRTADEEVAMITPRQAATAFDLRPATYRVGLKFSSYESVALSAWVPAIEFLRQAPTKASSVAESESGKKVI
jgi:hypothetical protein